MSTLKNKESTDQDRTKAQIKYRETHMGYSVLRFEIYLIQRRFEIYLIQGTTWTFVPQAISEEAAAFHRNLSASHKQIPQSLLLDHFQLPVDDYTEYTHGHAWDWTTGLEHNTSIEPNSSACTNVIFDVDGGRGLDSVNVTSTEDVVARMRRLTNHAFTLDGDDLEPSASSTTESLSLIHI